MDDRTPYERIGGDAKVRLLVDRFYDEMESQSGAQVIRAMHPPDLASSRDKLYQFLSGWLGGPGLYVAEHGHPRLRMRHAPFAVDASARDAWMACMGVALEEVVEDERLRAWLHQSLSRVAEHMRNSS